ncbi:MAG: aspartyl-tRNA synthetase [Sphingobacteriales bacterium]|jgi:aspartyl-tRNA synthetase
MYRTHTCGELRIEDVNKKVTLCGWVQKSRDLGGLTFIDIRDRYGITQLAFNEDENKALTTEARKSGREFVIQITGTVIERTSKNKKMLTGEVEIKVEKFEILNPALVPPFIIDDETDGGEELLMKYRYLDLRRPKMRANLELRHKVMQVTRRFLDSEAFIEVETPILIKSTPEGARDFLVPSRMNQGQFYALPQSPQTFKQLLMVSGLDKYFQIVKCFRDEDLRADRQPEFTQIDCEMSFVERDDILNIFEALMKKLFKEVKEVDLLDFPRITYADAMKYYGSDKPDVRFDMKFVDFTEKAQNKGFNVFDEAEIVIGIVAEGCASYSRKQVDALTDYVRKPQIGAKGMVYVKFNEDGTAKSSVDKFYSAEQLQEWKELSKAKDGDLLLILSGPETPTQNALNELRLHMARELGLMDKNVFSPLWVVDFPLFEWDEDTQRFYAMHHPFTSVKPGDEDLFAKDKGAVRANAYDMVINGVEVGGGSIRIHDKNKQKQMFDALGMSEEEAKEQFGFLMNAFEYGAPPHGGIAFGFDRLCALFAGVESIRDVIAFPKNNSGRDVMIDSPSAIDKEQMTELGLDLKVVAKA